jgi:Cys-tRNA(Pro)/Cys-tRNA(Cys) deacylase
MEKTNVMRLLDIAHIPYTPHEYDPEIVDGVTVAKTLGQNPECVFKTLICENEKKEHFVFDVPVAQELDLKKAAKVAGAKSIEMIPLKELLPLTGYLHGGCSPIGLKKPFPVFMDETAQLFDQVFISAGKRGFQVELSPIDLCRYTELKFFDLVR